MKKYKYQMHMHSLPCSACSKATPEELAGFLYEGGYNGGVVTNHFKGGNTGIDRKLPWNDFVKAYEDDYLSFKKAGEKYKLDILFGVEQGIGGGKEILVYGITPEILYKHPELNTSNPQIWYEALKPYGAMIYQAHPFREADYIRDVGAMTDFIDGIEVYNASNNIKNNMEAEDYAQKHKELLLISGGDAHSNYRLCNGGIETASPIKTEDDLKDILRRGAYNLITE